MTWLPFKGMPGTGTAVMLFEHPNYQGNMWLFLDDWHDFSEFKADPQDPPNFSPIGRVHSVKLAPYSHAELYPKPNYDGQMVLLKEDAPQFSGSIMSIKVKYIPQTIYSPKGCKGCAKENPKICTDLAGGGFDRSQPE